MDYGHADMNVTDQQRLAILGRLSRCVSRPALGVVRPDWL
jgi:hypothetical protein